MFIYRKTYPLVQKWIHQHNSMFTRDVKVHQNLGTNLSLACSEISRVLGMRTKFLQLLTDKYKDQIRLVLIFLVWT